MGCSALKHINIPHGITTIESATFENCSALQDIDIPDSITKIKMWAFAGCTSLKSIDIPSSVTHIGERVFVECHSLQGIHIHIIDIEKADINEGAFDEVDTDNSILFIPPGTRWAYRHHPVFGKFKNIEIEKQN